MARKLVVVTALALLSAGCVLAEFEGAQDDLAFAGDVAPGWAVGNHWTYDTSWWGEATLVVTGVDDGDWLVGTSNAELAWSNVREDVSFLDAVRRSDLAGTQDGERVRYFDFPLEEGKSWNTTWSGEARTIRVADVGDVVTLEAYQEDRLTVVYTYDPVVGWFRDMVILGENGDVFYSMTLVDHASGFSGDVVRWNAERLGASSDSNQVGGAELSYSVADDAGELFVAFVWECDGQEAAYLFTLAAPGVDAPRTANGACASAEETLVIPDPQPGPWQQSFRFTSLPGPASVAMEAWSRTLEQEPVEP